MINHRWPRPPKMLQWLPNVDQHFECDQTVLVTSGCSFTAATTDLTCASTWPGYVRDRCGFDHCVDLSYPAVGNEYIANSVLNHVEDLTASERSNIMVLVCWTGPDRRDTMQACTTAEQAPCIDNVQYTHDSGLDPILPEVARAEAWRSWKNIVFLQNYLRQQQIPFGFSLYFDTISPSPLPRRDRTGDFAARLSASKLHSLKQCNWLHKFQQSFFDFCFYQFDCLAEDQFHPNAKGSLLWCDQVLLPGMLAQNLITRIPRKIDQ